MIKVSIQPKPKNGLRVGYIVPLEIFYNSFNPAEAEEWFKRATTERAATTERGFNPAEAEEWFKSL